nr:hypothetical protein [Novosphingobium panipatense]
MKRIEAMCSKTPMRRGGLLASGAAALLAGCGAPPKVAVAPPPPPPVVVIPPRPQPPLGASPTMVIPARLADGSRATVNSGISAAQALWNLRSAYNVAALNCTGDQGAPILAGYTEFQKKYARTLTATNKALDKEYRARFGAKAIREREAYQTQVYNFFALPPVVPSLCRAALELTGALQAVPAAQLESFAAASGLAGAEAPFRAFFDSYEQYQSDLAAWESQYGASFAAAEEAPRS